MTVATIDIGTNTVLLLVVEFGSDGRMTTRLYEQRVPRLGRGVDAHGTLHYDSMTRVVDVLLEYRRLLAAISLDALVVCGTSAVRDASNRGEFARRIRAEVGFELEVLSGEDEALWTYRGAISGIPEISRATVVDIGGGSTELATGDRKTVVDYLSLQIGSVRLTERIFRHDPPSHPELEAAIDVIEDEISRAARFPVRGSTLVGVAGTATTLAVLAQGLAAFDIRAVTNFRLTRERTEELFRMLRSMPSDRIRALSTVMEGRHDVIVAGTLILREILVHFGFDELIVSERGVRYGLAIREWEKRGKV